jgi:hypothetical protein
VDERRDVLALLLAAAATGDPRTPGALSILLPADEQKMTLTGLLSVQDPDVRAAWRGLGLLRWKLDLPLPSFRRAAQEQFLDMIQKPAGALPNEDDAMPMPAALKALVLDLVDGKGPIDAAAATALPEELREAMLVNAATNALARTSPRALQYALLLGAAAHRDLFEAAAGSQDAAFAAAGKAALAQLPN